MLTSELGREQIVEQLAVESVNRSPALRQSPPPKVVLRGRANGRPATPAHGLGHGSIQAMFQSIMQRVETRRYLRPDLSIEYCGRQKKRAM